MITLEKLNERPLSYSSLKEFSKSPAHYIEYLRKEFKPTPAMALGSLVHCLLLQPNELGKQFFVMPNIDKRTKEGKAKYEEAVEASKGKQIVTESDYEDANNLVNKVLSEGHIANAIQQCFRFEHEWKQEIYGLPFRGFFDGEAYDYILEVKTASDANPKTIINDFFNRSYHIQGGLYSMVSNKPVKYLIIETTAPYNVVLADATEDYIQYGIKEVERLSASFLECMNNHMFNMGYDYFTEGNMEIGLPSWLKR